MSPTLRAAVLTGLLLTATACAAERFTLGEQREQFARYAGPPIERFTYLGRYEGWRALGDDLVVVWTDINTTYLLTIEQPCLGLHFESDLRLTSSAHTVTQGIDAVLVQHQRCRVSEIRHVNYAQMRKDLHLVQ